MRFAVVFLVSFLALTSASIDFQEYSAEIIQRINSMDTTWKAGPNFLGETLESVIARLGVKYPLPVEKRLPLYFHEDVSDIPMTFDARQKWPKCTTISLIRDQAACGSCWAFGAVEAMSDRECIHNNVQVNISAEELNSCCESCGNGCAGGFPNAAWEFWKTHGLVSGGLYNSKSGCQPYSIPGCDHHEPGHLKPCGPEVPTPPCHHTCRTGYNVTFDKDRHFGGSVYSVHSKVKQIQKEIMMNGPVEADFTVYADFPTYRSGVYQHKTGSVLGGHAVKILGWGTEGGVDYWLVANSWNPDWGDKGYFKIKRGDDECGIEDDINAGIPKKM
ncbi:cathepsin B-like [Acanthaster planci]|uniref:Cathepsin B-like n=1 Tax=Acanthaster planci TaxID=133434 RepID=A0A8B7YHW2_ACAPL|nr:cathepsin B-like [Acanthaster planci]XP_022091211.1 cathepsin B-like [Acanthaster planci]XP_022091212.1 cathepsin B-like [Acanthaster planci]XP_022091213.1 cathepsin B-like [Acanthaster planci]